MYCIVVLFRHRKFKVVFVQLDLTYLSCDEAWNIISLVAAFPSYGASQVFIPTVTKSIQQPDLMSESIESLSSCVFVQEVEAPALAVLIPVLVRVQIISECKRGKFPSGVHVFAQGVAHKWSPKVC